MAIVIAYNIDYSYIVKTMKGTVVLSSAYFSEPRAVEARHKRKNENHPGVPC